jgi:hypothetical protein
MPFTDLQEGILEEFVCAAAMANRSSEFENRISPHGDLNVRAEDGPMFDRRLLRGMHIVNERHDAPLTPKQRARHTVMCQVAAHARIKAAILAGERPRSVKSGRGRPPKRWLCVAAELGIDLYAAATPECSESCLGRDEHTTEATIDVP